MVLVKKDMLKYVHNVKIVREMGRNISDHYVVLCKVTLIGTWFISNKKVNDAGRTRVRSLKSNIKKRNIQGLLRIS